MPKISAYNDISNVENNDLLVVVDVNDTSMAPTGTTKKMTLSQLLGQTAFTFGSTGAAPSSGSFTAGAMAIDQNGVMRVCLTSGTPGTWTRVGQQSNEFWVDDYGALGNGKVFINGSGSSGTTAFHDTTNSPFVSGDTGKVIVVNQGTTGSNTAPFSGTLTYVSSSQVTLSGNLGAAAAGAPYVYGTDDQPAILNCVLAAYAWFLANNQKVRIRFSAKIYMLATFVQNTAYAWTGGITGQYNAHIPLPMPPETGNKFQGEFIGSGFAAGTQFWESLTPQVASGTVLMSTGTTNASQPDSTYGQAAIIQSGNTGSSSLLSPWINAMFLMDGITLMKPYNSPTAGVDVLFYGQMAIETSRFCAFAPINLNNTSSTGGPNLFNSALTTNSDFAIRTPEFLSNALNQVGWMAIEGYSIGLSVAEHFAAEYIAIDYANIGLQVNTPTASPATHAITAQHMYVQNTNYAFYVLNGSGSGFGNGTCPINIGMLDMETINTSHVYDPNSNLVGIIYWSNNTATHPVTTGAQNLIIINTTRVQPGPWGGAPAAPSSTAAQQNLAYRYATVYASSTGSISAVSVGQGTASMTSLGLTAGPGAIAPVRVNPGAWYALTYSGTASTTWVLD